MREKLFVTPAPKVRCFDLLQGEFDLPESEIEVKVDKQKSFYFGEWDSGNKQPAGFGLQLINLKNGE